MLNEKAVLKTGWGLTSQPEETEILKATAACKECC